MKITITNWEKYNLRPDVKSTSWFRMQNNFCTDPDFFNLTNDEKMVWVYLLCFASQKRTDTLALSASAQQMILTLLKVKMPVLESAVKKLVDIQAVTVDVTRTLRECNVNVTTQKGQTDRQTEITDTTDVKTDAYRDLRVQIIDYLNNKTGKNFKPHSKKSSPHINARLDEGYKLDNFFKVVDVKTKSWLGDAMKDEWLRPWTLFGPKMEGYVNEGIEEKPLYYPEINEANL